MPDRRSFPVWQSGRSCRSDENTGNPNFLDISWPISVQQIMRFLPCRHEKHPISKKELTNQWIYHGWRVPEAWPLFEALLFKHWTLIFWYQKAPKHWSSPTFFRQSRETFMHWLLGRRLWFWKFFSYDEKMLLHSEICFSPRLKMWSLKTKTSKVGFGRIGSLR